MFEIKVDSQAFLNPFESILSIPVLLRVIAFRPKTDNRIIDCDVALHNFRCLDQAE